MIGAAITLLAPGRHPAAKLGGLKWSLYLGGLGLFAVGVWYAYFEIHSRFEYSWSSSPFHWLAFMHDTPPVPAMLWGAVYGVWWAMGMAASPYGAARAGRAFVAFLAVYAAVWLLVVYVLFPTGAMGGLL